MAFSNQGLGCLPWMTTYRSINTAPRWTDRLLRQSLAQSNKLQWKDLMGHYGCVNAIEFSNGLGQYIASGGDDRRVLFWDVEKALSDIGKPAVMKGEHHSNIFCVAFDINNKVAFSGGNDEQVIVHDLTTGDTKDVFSHDDAVYGLSPDPTNASVFASACDDGRVLIYDIRDSCADPFCLANYTSSMHSVMYNPLEPRLLATANAKEGVGLWDVRKPRSCLMRYGGSLVQQSCMSVRFNQRGDQIIALRRRLPPVLYKIDSHVPVCEFDHSGYYNSCTMKSITFAGDNDQYVLSGSDEFNLYMWAVPDDLSERSYVNSAHMVLRGHRSIVNQVRFNPANHLIISSGVEKIIKVWSPFKLSTKEENARKSSTSDRRVYSHEEYINLVLQNGNVMSHDYSMESTDEDPRMMAFFDSLVQRELDDWSSDDSMTSNEEALYSRIVQLSQSDIDSDDSLPDLGQNDDNDDGYSPFTIAFASVMAMQTAEGNERFPRLNRALENAERVNAATRAEAALEPVSSSSDEEDDIPAPDLNTTTEDRNADDPVMTEARKRKELSDLIIRKKRELKKTMERRLKYARDNSSDSSEDSDELTDTDENVKSNEKSKTVKNTRKHSDSVAKSIELGKSKEAKIKLTRLKNLRNSVMNNDSETQDLEIAEKITSVVPSTSSAVEKDGKQEKVEFKKFIRKKRTFCDKSENDKNETSRSSSDLGPFLKQTGVNSLSEGKKGASSSNEGKESSVQNGDSHSKGKKSGETFSVKGKHRFRGKTSRQHSESDSDNNTDEKNNDSPFKSDKDTRLKHDNNDSGKSGHHSHYSSKKSRRNSSECENRKDKKGYASNHRHYHESRSSHRRKHDDHKDHDRDTDSERQRDTARGHCHCSDRRKSEKDGDSCDHQHSVCRKRRHRSKSDSYTVVASKCKIERIEDSESNSRHKKRCEKRSCKENDLESHKHSSIRTSSKHVDKKLMSKSDNMDTGYASASDSGDNYVTESDNKSCCSHANKNDKKSFKSLDKHCTETSLKMKRSKHSSEKDSKQLLCDNDLENKSNGVPLPSTSSESPHDSGSNHVTDSSQKTDSSHLTDSSDNQSTWLEFKRFKNRLERARKRYDKEKLKRKEKRTKSHD